MKFFFYQNLEIPIFLQNQEIQEFFFKIWKYRDFHHKKVYWKKILLEFDRINFKNHVTLTEMYSKVITPFKI